jgi:hypothetical protein
MPLPTRKQLHLIFSDSARPIFILIRIWLAYRLGKSRRLAAEGCQRRQSILAPLARWRRAGEGKEQSERGDRKTGPRSDWRSDDDLTEAEGKAH